MRIRKSLEDSADGYLWEDHFKRIEKREYAARTYDANYRSGWRHVVRKPPQSTSARRVEQRSVPRRA